MKFQKLMLFGYVSDVVTSVYHENKQNFNDIILLEKELH